MIFDSLILGSYHDGNLADPKGEISQRKLNCALFVKFSLIQDFGRSHDRQKIH